MNLNAILDPVIRRAVETAVMLVVESLRGLTVEQIVKEIMRLPATTKQIMQQKKQLRADVPPPPKPPLSPARRKALKIQGTYIGLLRNFTGKERKAMQKLAEKDRNAAITKMRKLVKAR